MHWHRRRRRRPSHHGPRPHHVRRHDPLAVNHGLDLGFRHARGQQTLAHLAPQLGLGLFLLGLFLGRLLGLRNVPALHGFLVGLFARRGGRFGGLLLLELCEGVFFDDALALGLFLFGLSDCVREVDVSSSMS